MSDKILIVDDDLIILETLHECIVNIGGLNASTATCADDAIKILKEKSFDVVITDIQMPGMSGLDLTTYIKEKYNSDVIVMTGYTEDYSYEEAIGRGASDIIFKPIHLKELLLRLKRVLKERENTKERLKMMETLNTLATTDGLTQLHNSRHFYNQMEMEISRTNRYNQPLSLLLIDIDDFKTFNDTYGHLAGDKILSDFGELVKSLLRHMDSAYRYGGEEFTIILPGTKGQEASAVAERIRKKFEKVKHKPETEKIITITISIGCAQYNHEETMQEFIKRADTAMYLSKTEGKNRVTYLSD